MKNRRTSLGQGLLFLSFAVAACSGKEKKSDAPASPTASPGPSATLPTSPEGQGCLSPLPDATGARLIGNGSPESCTEEALRTALADLPTDKTTVVLFRCGDSPHTIPLNAPLVVKAPVTLAGPKKEGKTACQAENLVTLDGQGKTRILEVAHEVSQITVQNLNFNNGYATDNPVGSSEIPAHSGGAIAKGIKGSLTLLGSSFFGNKAAKHENVSYGGAVYVNVQNTVEVKGCTFVKNHSASGGALYTVLSDVSISDSVFAENGISNDGTNDDVGKGGAVEFDGGKTHDGGMTITRTAFFQNATRKDGTGRTSSISGGALFLYLYTDNQANITESVFQENASDAGGGAILAGASQNPTSTYSGTNTTGLKVAFSTFDGNKANGVGAALHMAPGLKAELRNTTFVNNTLPRSDNTNGAGIYTEAAWEPLTVSRSTFYNNNAGQGAAIFEQDNAPTKVRLEKSILINAAYNTWGTWQNCARKDFGGAGGNVQYPRDSTETHCGADPVLESHEGFRQMPQATPALAAWPGHAVVIPSLNQPGLYSYPDFSLKTVIPPADSVSAARKAGATFED